MLKNVKAKDFSPYPFIFLFLFTLKVKTIFDVVLLL